MTPVAAGTWREADPADPVGAAVARVLLVSGQDGWAAELALDLAADGFRVQRDRTGESVFDDDVVAPIDIAVVDLGLRAQSGLAVCGALRARSMLPIIAVGSDSEEHAVLAALASGADQVVSIESSSRLLVARLRALLRRVPPRTSVRVEPRHDAVVTIDETTETVLVAGAVVKLSRREMEVLRALVARPGRVVTRAELAGSWPTLSSDRRLDFVIRRLRQKLEIVDGKRRISAVRGVGFRFEE